MEKEKNPPGQLDERIASLEEQSRRIQKELAVLRSERFTQTLLQNGQDGYPPRENHAVTRLHQGLTINGSRLTLYFLRDHIAPGNSLKNVRDLFALTDEEMLDILDYLHLNRESFEKEYQQALKSADEHRKYWEYRNHSLADNARQQSATTIARLREKSKQYRARKKVEDSA